MDVFRVEREALMRLRDHPHVIQILDADTRTIELGGKNYHALVLELAPHKDLLPYIQLRPFDDILARTYFKQLLWAVGSAHRVGVYHRDIKLENMLLSPTFSLKLADFGLAHVLSPDQLGWVNSADCEMLMKYQLKPVETKIRGLVGSPGYVAPEISKTSYYLGSAVDVWCVLFAMLVGHSAFEVRCPSMRTQDPWLRLLVEGKYATFWREHVKFCGVQVSEFAVGKCYTYIYRLLCIVT
jgi:serine/threonine protein kinase